MIENPEFNLEEGRKLVNGLPLCCRGCDEALQGACEVVRFALDQQFDLDQAGIIFGAVVKLRCRPQEFPAKPCEFHTEPLADLPQESVPEYILREVEAMSWMALGEDARPLDADPPADTISFEPILAFPTPELDPT